MTNLFKHIRFTAFACVFAFSAVVLGLAAHFAAIFLPRHHDFLIFTLVIPTFTLVMLMVLSLRSQPRIDIFFILLLSILWLAQASYAADMIGHVECDALSGQREPTKTGTYSSSSYCRQMKVILAFSWMNFVLLVLSFVALLNLTLRVHARGNLGIWGASVSELPFFHEQQLQSNGTSYPYPAGGHHSPQGSYGPPQSTYGPVANYGQPNIRTYGPNEPIYQLPGHSVILTTAPDGTREVQQVPTSPP